MEKIRKYIEMAMHDGVETPYKNTKDKFQRSLKLDSGKRVVVVFIKISETIWRIGTAWVE